MATLLAHQHMWAAATVQEPCNTTDLDGGFQAWREAGLPVTKP